MEAANALLWKVNQIGTLTEALDAAAYAYIDMVMGFRFQKDQDRQKIPGLQIWL